MQLTLDVAYEEDESTLTEVLEAIAAEVPGLTWEVLEEDGPAGWPLVAFTVPEASLAAFAEAYGLEPEELEA